MKFFLNFLKNVKFYQKFHKEIFLLFAITNYSNVGRCFFILENFKISFT